jgi:hypothetical protein
VNDPFRTTASIVVSGTPWFSTTMISRPFGSVSRRNSALELGALRREAATTPRARAATP